MEDDGYRGSDQHATVRVLTEAIRAVCIASASILEELSLLLGRKRVKRLLETMMRFKNTQATGTQEEDRNCDSPHRKVKKAMPKLGIEPRTSRTSVVRSPS